MGADSETLVAYFDSFRFVFTVLASTWVFIRGTAPKRNHCGTTAVCCIAAAVALSVINPVMLAATAASDMRGLSPFAFMQVWTTAAFLLALIAMKCCYVVTWTNAISRWILGLCVERFVTAFIYNWLFLAIIPDFQDGHPYAYMAICVVIYMMFILLAASLLAPRFSRNTAPDQAESRTLCVLYGISFVVLVLVTNWSMHIAEYDIPNLAKELTGRTTSTRPLTGMLYFSTCMAGVIAIVIMAFQYAIYHVAMLHRETAMLNLLAEQKSRQYRTLTDNIDFINRKAHDLKHQIAALEFGDDERRHQLVQETRDAIATYDSTVNTGNEALDTLLTERNFYCARHGIRFSCAIGDCDFSAIDVVDLFTMVGNALDNAFEYVTRFDDPDKRVVSIGARQHGNLIVITVDNYFDSDTPLTLADGLPATTKADAFSHGLGLKSIRQIARRYDGDIRVTARKPMFTLQISLIIPE